MINRTSRAVRRVGFTLMEVLVVVAILVILAGVGGVIMLKYLDDARIDKAKIDVKSLEGAAERYKLKNGEYPASLEVMAVQQPDGSAAYIDETMLKDPWGQPYVIEPQNLNPNTHKPRIYSPGPQGGANPVANW